MCRIPRTEECAATLFAMSPPPTGRMLADCRHPPCLLRPALGPEEIAETSPDCTADSVPFDADLRLAGNDELRF